MTTHERTDVESLPARTVIALARLAIVATDLWRKFPDPSPTEWALIRQVDVLLADGAEHASVRGKAS